MRLTALFSGREALITEGEAIASVADNLANANTPGFKTTRTEFANLLANSEGSLYGSAAGESGNGVQVDNFRVLHDKQGTINFTDKSLDLAIQGGGFFVTTKGTETFYTRAGNFSVDKDGNVITSTGENVMGFTTASAATPVALNVSGVTGGANPSTTASLNGNADSSSPLVATLPTAPTTFTAASAGSDMTIPLNVTDSLGQAHNVSLYFFHTAQLGYTIQAYANAGETGGAPGTPVLLGTGTIAFDNTGHQATSSAITGTPIVTMTINAPWSNGAAASAVTVDLSNFTGFASQSSPSKVVIDGNGAGNPTGYEVLKDGTLNVSLDSGSFVKVGNLVLANFRNKDGLRREGSNKYIATEAAGTPAVGLPGAEGRGTIVGSALESSTADPASEFVDLVKFQRAYQAGSQIIKTASELLSTTIQLG